MQPQMIWLNTNIPSQSLTHTHQEIFQMLILWKLIILIYYQRTSFGSEWATLSAPTDSVEAFHWGSTVIDGPVYYLTLSSQYISHEYAIASIDAFSLRVHCTNLPTSTHLQVNVDFHPKMRNLKDRFIKQQMNISEWFMELYSPCHLFGFIRMRVSLHRI